MHCTLRTRRDRGPAGFTLVELLVVMSIIGILAGMSVMAIQGAVESGKRQRARAQISKIDQFIQAKWNSYRFRQVRLQTALPSNQRAAAQVRLYGLRELMRMEMPDRMTDIATDPAMPIPRPSLSSAYLRKVMAAKGNPPFDTVNEQAECLYLILAEMRESDTPALSAFLSSEIGDTDGDGLKEILDPWGTPIRFLRWAPGYSVGTPDWSQAPYSMTPASLNGQYWPSTVQSYEGDVAADPFDPARVDPRCDPTNVVVQSAPHIKPFALLPLVLSAGPDKDFDVQNGYYNADGTSGFNYANTKIGNQNVPNDPYYVHIDTNAGKPLPWIGACLDTNGDSRLSYGDNITNHDLKVDGE